MTHSLGFGFTQENLTLFSSHMQGDTIEYTTKVLDDPEFYFFIKEQFQPNITPGKYRTKIRQLVFGLPGYKVTDLNNSLRNLLCERILFHGKKEWDFQKHIVKNKRKIIQDTQTRIPDNSKPSEAKPAIYKTVRNAIKDLRNTSIGKFQQTLKGKELIEKIMEKEEEVMASMEYPEDMGFVAFEFPRPPNSCLIYANEFTKNVLGDDPTKVPKALSQHPEDAKRFAKEVQLTLAHDPTCTRVPLPLSRFEPMHDGDPYFYIEGMVELSPYFNGVCGWFRLGSSIDPDYVDENNRLNLINSLEDLLEPLSKRTKKCDTAAYIHHSQNY